MRKATLLVSNCLFLSALQRSCSCEKPHSATYGRTSERQAWTEPMAIYPQELASKLVESIRPAVNWVRPETLLDSTPSSAVLTCSIPEVEEEKRRVPPVSHRWARPSRWRRVARVRWGKEEHINLLELRAWLLCLRHAARCPDRRSVRVVFMVDSMVVLGAVAKGRSSVWSINQLLRRSAGISLFWGTKVMMRFVRTSHNCADGPSRGLRIGVAPSPKLRKQRRA